jgi:hypothetical protein
MLHVITNDEVKKRFAEVWHEGDTSAYDLIWVKGYGYVSFYVLDERNVYLKRVVSAGRNITLKLPLVCTQMIRLYKCIWTVPDTEQQCKILEKQGFKRWETYLAVGRERLTLHPLIIQQIPQYAISDLLVKQRTN